MFYTFATSPASGSLLLQLIGCLQLAFTDVSSAIPASYKIASSVGGQGSTDLGAPSTKSSNQRGNLETGCQADQTAEYRLQRRLPFADHLLEKHSSYESQSVPDTEVNDRMRQLEPASGYREGGTGNQLSRPAMNRPIWNVPFRAVYGSGRNVVKFGKRAHTGGFDGYRFKFGKRSADGEKRMFKFGKRLNGYSDDQSLSSAEEKRMFKFGKRTDDLQDNQNLETGEGKRMFKFGRRADSWSGESRLPAEEEKRMFKFGKRFTRFPADQNNSAEDEKPTDNPQRDLNLGIGEEKRKFSFGKRTDDDDIQVVPNVSGGEEERMLKYGEWPESLPEGQILKDSEEEVKRMIKFGKKADQFNDDKLSTLEAEGNGLVQSPDVGKRMFKFGKKSGSIGGGTGSSEGKRKFMFGKRDETVWDGKQQGLDGGLNALEIDAEELSEEKRRQKFQFGRRLAPDPDELSAKMRRKFKLGKRSE